MGLIDDITPPSTVFAAFNHYAGPKEIEVYPFNGHEGGGTTQFLAKLAFLAKHAWPGLSGERSHPPLSLAAPACQARRSVRSCRAISVSPAAKAGAGGVRGSGD